jgi:SAM-dependent methyltransferase
LSASGVEFIPTPDRVIAEMLRLAAVGTDDLVYDLGCGDGRILITAALERGARGVGIEIDPALVDFACRNAAEAGVEHLVRFECGNFFKADLSAATVVTLYLLDSLNERLRPNILSQTAPGTRVVSYSFEMGDWQPDEHTPIAANGVSLWIVPAHAAGSWEVENASADLPLKHLVLEQRYQMLSGSAEFQPGQRSIVNGHLIGSGIRLELQAPASIKQELHGQILGDALEIRGPGATIRAHRIGNRAVR